MLQEQAIGFMGGGQMAEAILRGALEAGGITPKQVVVADVSAGRLEELATRYGVETVQNDAEGSAAARLAACSMVVLAVKPQYAAGVLQGLQHLPAETLVLSIMGGVTLETLEAALPGRPVVRVMPNTPMMVGKGVAGLAAGSHAGRQHIALAEALFGLVGSVHLLPENLIDPLTAVSGCGPAYAYLFIEALADGGVEMGLPRHTAQQLAAQMLAGAAEMVLQTGQHPGALKDSVCSPGGGTIVGVHALEEGAFRATVMNAVVKACEKMGRLG